MSHSITLALLKSLLVFAILFSQQLTVQPEPVVEEAVYVLPGEGVELSLSAASNRMIEFKTKNGRTVKDQAPQTIQIPHLVLRRNGALTPVEERTLHIQINGLEFPAAELSLNLSIATLHDDSETGEFIPVWQKELQMVAPAAPGEIREFNRFNLVFTETVQAGGPPISTPTDYYQLEFQAVSAGQTIAQVETSVAFLMENQEVLSLPPVLEDGSGAAPDVLIVFYADMFPYRSDRYDQSTWLERESVPAYVREELAPALVTAYMKQSLDWGFSWHSAWSGHRDGEFAEQLTVALADGETWYHGAAPGTGHAGISLNVQPSYGEQARYQNMTEKLLGTFYHELFHNYQRSLVLHHTGLSATGGQAGAWSMFSEGTAMLAASVGQSAFQFSPNAGRSDYLAQASNFIIEDLGKAYGEIEAYHTALYWRFLYEQCGGMQAGREDPARGMAIIRRALETLYSGRVVDIHTTTDIDAYLVAIMDETLNGSECPFQSFSASQEAFKAAISRLSTPSGHCDAPGLPQSCGFFDPNRLYPAPKS